MEQMDFYTLELSQIKYKLVIKYYEIKCSTSSKK